MVIIVFYKSVQRTVDRVILARLDFDGDGREAVVIVDQIIDLPPAPIIIVIELIPMGNKFAGHNALVYRTLVDALLVIQDSPDIVAVKDRCEYPHVVEIEFQKVLAG